MSAPLCIHCGKPAEEHCDGFERAMPDGCQCASGEWGDEVKPICAEYVGNGTQYCERCEHDYACHKAAK